MRIAVFVLALIGALIGLVGTMGGLGLAAIVGGLAQDQATEQAATEAGSRLLLGFGAAIVTIIAGSAVLARKAPRRWGVVLIAANVIGLLAAGGFYLFGGILGLVAGLLALVVRPTPVGSSG
jgi:uncharacterized BrkB/YihY/UPF0761 family membrane protein